MSGIVVEARQDKVIDKVSFPDPIDENADKCSVIEMRFEAEHLCFYRRNKYKSMKDTPEEFYNIPLAKITDVATLLDWILHLQSKPWGTPMVIGTVIMMLSSLLSETSTKPIMSAFATRPIKWE